MSYFVKVKNKDAVACTWGGLAFAANEERIIEDSDLESLRKDTQFMHDVADSLAEISSESSTFTDPIKAWDYIQGSQIEAKVVEQPEQHPFASPDYRTKMAKTPSMVNIAPGSSEVIDLVITEERHVAGGKLILKNAEFGDYVSAEVIDLNNVIPEIYRPVICENHPTVAKYVEGMWIEPGKKNEIDTKPLNAKITAGLVLRVTYYATTEGGNRSCGINYYLTKKL